MNSKITTQTIQPKNFFGTEKSSLNTFWGELAVRELIRCGIDYFCISPGSRSTALTVAVARNREAKSIICYDERGSAFHALGYARATGKPGAVITSSGTAAANLYPAVMEAYQDNIPLMVLTADRPPELQKTNANQTIDQTKIFGDFLKWHFSFPCPSEVIAPEFILTTMDQAFYQASNGPVHLNFMFREPLEPEESTLDEGYLKNIRNWQSDSKPFTSYKLLKKTCDQETIATVSEIINQTEKGLIAVGKLASEEERGAISKIIDKLNWPVYADITSGLRLGKIGTNIIRHFDQKHQSEWLNENASPRVVLQFGGRITSKRYPEFLDRNRPQHYIMVKNNSERYDPLHAVSMHIESDLCVFCEQLNSELHSKKSTDHALFFSKKKERVQEIIERGVSDFPEVSEAYVARIISKEIREGSSLFLSSSMPIRDMDLYSIEGKENIQVASNRGVSGIDGVMASGSGFAVGNKSQTTLLIGDLAFIHDLSSLSMVSSISSPLVIVVINNQGGGIFHFLPIVKSEDVFEKYFATPHNFSFRGVSETFNIPYYFSDTKESFRIAYQKALNSMGHAVIEVKTDRKENLNLRKKIKTEILEVLEK